MTVGDEKKAGAGVGRVSERDKKLARMEGRRDGEGGIYKSDVYKYDVHGDW